MFSACGKYILARKKKKKEKLSENSKSNLKVLLPVKNGATFHCLISDIRSVFALCNIYIEGFNISFSLSPNINFNKPTVSISKPQNLKKKIASLSKNTEKKKGRKISRSTSSTRSASLRSFLFPYTFSYFLFSKPELLISQHNKIYKNKIYTRIRFVWKFSESADKREKKKAVEKKGRKHNKKKLLKYMVWSLFTSIPRGSNILK